MTSVGTGATAQKLAPWLLQSFPNINNYRFIGVSYHLLKICHHSCECTPAEYFFLCSRCPEIAALEAIREMLMRLWKAEINDDLLAYNIVLASDAQYGDSACVDIAG